VASRSAYGLRRSRAAIAKAAKKRSARVRKQVKKVSWLQFLTSAGLALLLLTIRGEGLFFLLIVRRSGFMRDKSSDLVQGTLDMLILKTLALEPMHGYGIAVRLEQMSKGVFRLNAGSLFVAFQRLQRAGLVRSEWKATENSRRAKYYVLTDQGRKRLNSETREWGRQVAAIARILEAS
jgi:PadR family transcriptional regulator PadR